MSSVFISSLHIHTPLLYSHSLSQWLGKKVYIKYESLQPSGSFKDRGIGALCQHYAAQSAPGFISSSGGNAGMAVAYASRRFHIPATIVIPKTTPTMMVEKLRAQNATVLVQGENWDESDLIARNIAQTQNLSYIPPFDNPLIWQGYESLIQELKIDNVKPDAILVSVGGGGLLCGLIQGLHKIGWNDVAMITSETLGAASLAQAYQQKKRIRLDKIDTVATTLGAKQICQQAFAWLSQHPIFPQTVTDKEAINACLRFADDQRVLVEPSCGAALALVYEKRPVLQAFETLVVVACGGSGVNLDLLKQWKTQFQLD